MGCGQIEIVLLGALRGCGIIRPQIASNGTKFERSERERKKERKKERNKDT